MMDYRFPDISPTQAIYLNKRLQEKREEKAKEILEENKPYLTLELTYVRTEDKSKLGKQTAFERNKTKARELEAKIALNDLKEYKNCVIV